MDRWSDHDIRRGTIFPMAHLGQVQGFATLGLLVVSMAVVIQVLIPRPSFHDTVHQKFSLLKDPSPTKTFNSFLHLQGRLIFSNGPCPLSLTPVSPSMAGLIPSSFFLFTPHITSFIPSSTSSFSSLLPSSSYFILPVSPKTIQTHLSIPAYTTPPSCQEKSR